MSIMQSHCYQLSGWHYWIRPVLEEITVLVICQIIQWHRLNTNLGSMPWTVISSCFDSTISFVNMAWKYGIVEAKTIRWALNLCSPTWKQTRWMFVRVRESIPGWVFPFLGIREALVSFPGIAQCRVVLLVNGFRTRTLFLYVRQACPAQDKSILPSIKTYIRASPRDYKNNQPRR